MHVIRGCRRTGPTAITIMCVVCAPLGPRPSPPPPQIPSHHPHRTHRSGPSPISLAGRLATRTRAVEVVEAIALLCSVVCALGVGRWGVDGEPRMDDADTPPTTARRLPLAMSLDACDLSIDRVGGSWIEMCQQGTYSTPGLID